MSRRRSPIAALFAIVALALAVTAAAGASPGTALVDGIPQRGTVLGSKAAPVTLIQFEDLACSHCADYMEHAFPTIVDEYVRLGLVKVDFRGLDIVSRQSGPALRYTLAAGRQNKLWQVAELFYENQSKLKDVTTDRGVRKLVSGVKGLNATRLIADAKSPAIRKQADAHLAEAERRDVPGTPWFLVKVGTGAPKVVRPEAYSGDAFRTILDKALGR
jgi:protein-disulfide isomerase